MRQRKFNNQDRVRIVSNKYSGHGFRNGARCEVTDTTHEPSYKVRSESGRSWWWVDPRDMKLIKTKVKKMTTKKSTVSSPVLAAAILYAVNETAKDLLSKGKSTTTNDIRSVLEKDYSEIKWYQKLVSESMMDLADSGLYECTDNGTYRTYTLPVSKTIRTPKTIVPPFISKTVAKRVGKATSKAAPKATKTVKATYISRTKAVDMIENSKGHFITVKFVKANGSEREINCQYMYGQAKSTLGYIKVKESCLMRSGADNCIKTIDPRTMTDLKMNKTWYKIKN